MGAHSAEGPFAGMLDGGFTPGVLVRHRGGRELLSPLARAWLFWVSASIATIAASIAVYAVFAAILL